MKAFFNPDTKDYHILFQDKDLDRMKKKNVLTGPLYYNPKVKFRHIKVQIKKNKTLKAYVSCYSEEKIHKIFLSEEDYLHLFTEDYFEEFGIIEIPYGSVGTKIRCFLERSEHPLCKETKLSFDIFSHFYL